MEDPTIGHDQIIVLFRLSRNGPAAECRRYQKQLVAACRTAVDEARAMKSWSVEMLEALDTLVDPAIKARVFPAELQPLLDGALIKARADEEVSKQSFPQAEQVQQPQGA